MVIKKGMPKVLIHPINTLSIPFLITGDSKANPTGSCQNHMLLFCFYHRFVTECLSTMHHDVLKLSDCWASKVTRYSIAQTHRFVSDGYGFIWVTKGNAHLQDWRLICDTCVFVKEGCFWLFLYNTVVHILPLLFVIFIAIYDRVLVLF